MNNVYISLDGSGEQQRVEFLEEIKLMKEVGQHKNIVSLLACVTQSFPLCLVVEFMPFGDLLHYLRGRRSKVIHCFYCYFIKFIEHAKMTSCPSNAVLDRCLLECYNDSCITYTMRCVCSVADRIAFP